MQAAADPEVLGHVAAVVKAAHTHDLTVEVCGEAAGEAPLVALLVGLGVPTVAAAVLEAARGISRDLGAPRWPVKRGSP